MAHDVFISYSHTDKPTADAACATLESRGIRCWIAPRDVLPGEEYASALVTAIHSSRLLVLVFSSGANQSPQVLREVERAVSKGLPILPLRIEDVAPSAAMEYYISSRHWLDALTTPLEQHLVQLADTVTLLLARSPGGSAPPAPPQAVKPVPPPLAEQREWPRAEPSPPPPSAPIEQPRAAPPSEEPRLAQRRRIAIAGTLILAILGVSARMAPTQLQYMFHWSNSQATFASVLQLMFLALGFAAGGTWLRRTSPRRIVMLAGLLSGFGALVASILLVQPPATFVVYVIATGLAAAGSALGFVAVVTTLLKWFPDRHGMVAGIASATWFAGVAPARRLFGYFGILWLVFLGLGSLIVVTLAARMFHDPEGGAPDKPAMRAPLTTPPWYALWILLFANTLVGALVIAVLAAIMQAESTIAPWLLDVLIVCQALGCLVWGVLSDRLGRRRVLLSVLVTQAILLLAVPGAIKVAVTPVLMVIIFLANGGGFSGITAAAADHFAPDVGARYGVLMTSWCLAFLGSASLVRVTREIYSIDIRLAAGIALVAAVLAFRLRPLGGVRT